MGFSGHLNGKMTKTSFSKAYRYLMYCMVHSLSHRKGAYDEVSDYIMNIVTSLVLNRRYNISQVIFEYMKENYQDKGDKYIMYPRFIMMLINDKIKDLPKNKSDIMDVRNITNDTIARITKENDAKTKQMICKIKNPKYVAPENDKWRHEKSDSDNEDAKMSEMIEKKTRWWCARDEKSKRTPKSSAAVSIPKDGEKGSSGEPQQRLIDETVLEPSVAIEQGIDLLNQSFESYLKKNEEAAAQKAQGSSVQAEDITTIEPEVEDLDSSSEDDYEATQSESELDRTTLGRGKAQLKKKSLKKKKSSDEEDSSYEPDEPKKQRKKRKAVQAGVIPRNVRARKSGAESSKEKGGKKEKHIQKSKALETEKTQSVETPKEPEVQSTEEPVVKAQKRTGGDDDYVEITGFKAATPRPPPQDKPESSHPKGSKFDYIFEGLPEATGIYTEDIPEDDYDMFNNEAVQELLQKVNKLEKEKAKTETEHDILKKQVDNLMNAHDQVRAVLIEQEEAMNRMKNEAHDNSKLFELLTAEIASLNVKIKNLEDVNQTLNQLLIEMSEASSNEMKAIKLEMEAMKGDKVVKDEHLHMLYFVMESHLKMEVHAAFNEIEVKIAEERRIERERRLTEEATQKNKSVIEDIQEAGGSSSQPEVGGSSSQQDIEMVDVQEQHVNEIQEQVMEDIIDEQGQDFMMIGESSEPFDVNNVLRRVAVIQRKRKAREVLLLEWKKNQFVLVGDATSVPYSGKEIACRMKIKERKRKAKIARGEIVDDDSDIELFGDEEEEEDEDDNDDKKDDKLDDNNDKDDKGNDDNDQGASGLLIRDPIVQERVEELMNDEINEQEDDLQNEASSSGKQHADQVLLSNPTVIYLNVQQEGEVEVRRTRAEMLEELGLEDGKFKFDIEDEFPQSPEKDFEPRYAYEVDHYDDVIIEDASDSSEDEVDFH
ncbi:glutamic acid-rich protein-like [Helianthus annuus]|uniref:glutamic acid-rich protein-like n=1 Tax=Helianthus annuus TaxID=4232 RepID=UPI000B904111|nr:glutamic acid-rich protein-like [Helianthus annuus]